VDVSSISLEACIGLTGPARAFSNTAEGVAELLAFCRQQGVDLVAMEASGGYEKQPFALL
jgi:transposase